MTSSRGAARAAVFFGALAVLAIPVAVLFSRYVSGFRLLEDLYVAVPVSAVCALIAVGSLRRARFVAARSVRADSGPGRVTRLLAWGGLYVAFTGAMALAVYGLLRLAQ
jgi:hypothetical protein